MNYSWKLSAHGQESTTLVTDGWIDGWIPMQDEVPIFFYQSETD